ncbi:sugar transferase [Lactiplantibacillus pentosus]|uniref:sugar transferase n=1 Tax=Lactiplantibacillus pentosus TaxID=1589 RepID=UPI001C1F2B9D|nr:sugar transferase [Lactiplantibacillus pentosus]MBU7530876.1 sugar transferase [Lactiplantibacillus pentosus]
MQDREKIEHIFIDIRSKRNDLSYRFIKRLLDIVASISALLLLTPVFLILIIAIKISSPREKVFYVQTRLGINETPFKMYKFRSMVSNADKMLSHLKSKNEVKGAMFKIKDDPRVTKIGHFMRKHSVDELPQLLNVLIGNMILVGPRTPLPIEVAEYTDYAKQRLLVKPGCTGLWQATVRNSVGFDGMLRLDLIYIANRSLWLDFEIIMKTLKVFV